MKYSIKKYNIPDRNIFLIIISFFCICFHTNSVFSQDVQFSQYYASPLLINPAYTGDHDRNWQFMNNFRTEWKSTINPFISTSLGYDQQVYLFEKRFSVGIAYVYDKSGTYMLTRNKIYLSGAYHHEVPDFIYNLGLQIGVVSEKYNSDNLTFPDQYDISLGQFNSNLPTNEEKLYESLLYPDINIGLSIRKRIGRFIPNAGISVHHINKPKISFQAGKKNQLPYSKLFHLGGIFHLTKKIYLEPDLLILSQIKSNSMIFGTKAAIAIPKNLYELKNFFIGSYFRMGVNTETNALIFNTGFVFYDLIVGISYDYNLTSLNNVTYNRGSLELSIIYKGQNTDLMKVTLPCDRY